MIDIIFHDKTGVIPYNPGQTGGFENAAGRGEIHYYRLFDGVGIMLLVSVVDYHVLHRLAIPVMLLSWALLVLVLDRRQRFKEEMRKRLHM